MSNNSYLEETVSEPAVKENDSVLSDEISKETKDELFERQKLMIKLKETEDEIETLRQVLGSKLRLAHNLKRKIGITPIDEIKDDINYGINLIKSSDKYKSTTTVLKNAKLKTQETLSTASTKISASWGAVRQTDKFKQLTGTVSSVTESIKKHITPAAKTSQTEPPKPGPTLSAEVQSQSPVNTNEQNNQ